MVICRDIDYWMRTERFFESIFDYMSDFLLENIFPIRKIFLVIILYK